MDRSSKCSKAAGEDPLLAAENGAHDDTPPPGVTVTPCLTLVDEGGEAGDPLLEAENGTHVVDDTPEIRVMLACEGEAGDPLLAVENGTHDVVDDTAGVRVMPEVPPGVSEVAVECGNGHLPAVVSGVIYYVVLRANQS